MDNVAVANHSGDGGAKRIEVQLTKSAAGFGFNVVGGSDIMHIPNDSGFFAENPQCANISRIRTNSAASKEDRISVGDRLISIDGIELSGKTHGEAVDIFRSIAPGKPVSLIVEKDGEKKFLNQVPVMPITTPVNTTEADSKEELPRTPLRPHGLLDLAHNSIWTEVLFVAIGTVVLGTAVIVGYRFVKRR